jgi:hypothetical protein
MSIAEFSSSRWFSISWHKSRRTCLSPSFTTCSSWNLYSSSASPPHCWNRNMSISRFSLLVRLASFCGLRWNKKFNSHLLRRLPVPFFSHKQWVSTNDLYYMWIDCLVWTALPSVVRNLRWTMVYEWIYSNFSMQLALSGPVKLTVFFWHCLQRHARNCEYFVFICRKALTCYWYEINFILPG